MGAFSGSGRNMTIQNNSALGSTAAIWLASVTATNGYTNNTIRNLEIACGADQSTSTNSTFGIAMCGTTISTIANGTNNDNNTFTANRIIKCRFGIMTRGTTTDNNFNITVSNNIIGPTAFGSDQIGKDGIFMQADSLSFCTGNLVQFVGVTEPQAAGGTDRAGIAIGTDAWSSTSTTTITSGGYRVTNNLVHDIVEENTFSAVGINVGTTRSGGITGNLIANNCIYNVRSNGTSGDAGAGIGHTGGRGDIIVFNSIRLTGDVDPGLATSASTNPIHIGISKHSSAVTDTAHTIKNNIIYMDLYSNTNTLLFACIQAPAAHTWGTGGLNNNDYFFPIANTQGRTGGTGTGTPTFLTLANWQTAYVPAQDGASIQVDLILFLQPIYTYKCRHHSSKCFSSLL
ncbi:MAG: hypothetical protein IPO27_03945 [Bacteroidetes bacterium]|nr:hypothetical protein [Bacteroidota bacterium]